MLSEHEVKLESERGFGGQGFIQPTNQIYVSNYDIDDNNIINMLDLYIAAIHFGQTDP